MGEADSSMERSPAVGARQQQGAPAQVDGRAAGERLVYRIGEQPPVGLVDQTDDLLQDLAERPGRRSAGELLGGGIEEGDAAVLVGGDDRLRQGLQRQQLWLGGAVAHHAQCRIGLSGNDLHSGDQQRVAGVEIDRRGADLQATHLPCIPTISIS